MKQDLPEESDGWLMATPAAVEEAWIDHNGHMHLPFYTVLFIRAISEVMELRGVGESYASLGQGSFFGAENHIRYLRELKAAEWVNVEICLLECDVKRLHWWAQMVTAARVPVATFELLSMHVDQTVRRAAPMPDALHSEMRDLARRQRNVGPPSSAWRVGKLATPL